MKREEREKTGWQEVLREKNPQLVLFQAVEEFLPEDFKAYLMDMGFERGILWIKVSHPSLVQLLFMKKTAIISKLRVLSTSLVVKDVRFTVSPALSVSPQSESEEPRGFSFKFAPTGEVAGEVVEIQNKRLKELMEALSHSIREREESKRR